MSNVANGLKSSWHCDLRGEECSEHSMFGVVGVLQSDRVAAYLSSIGLDPLLLFVTEWLLLALTGREEDDPHGLGEKEEEGEERASERIPPTGKLDSSCREASDTAGHEAQSAAQLSWKIISLVNCLTVNIQLVMCFTVTL